MVPVREGGEKLKLGFRRNRNRKRSGLKEEITIAIGLTDSVGYTPLSQNPDVIICVNKIADLVSNMTIHLMENSENGDRRIKNELSRKIDIEPHQNMTRKNWVFKIVRDLLLYGDGNSIVHIAMDQRRNLITDLTPFNMSGVGYQDLDQGYLIDYDGKTYMPDEVIHFAMNPDPNYPYKGKGYRIYLKDIVKNLTQANKTKNSFMSGKYMPSLILTVDALSEELAKPEGRDNILKNYIETTESGKPWVIPKDFLTVEQVKPLSLKDIALNEGVELDKKTIAGIFDVPAFFLGVGKFDKDEYNHFINTRIFSIGEVISQTLTRDLLFNPSWYIKLNPRSLYAYNLTEMVDAGGKMLDRTAIRRNELRNWVGLDPDPEMEELLALENYIPVAKLGDQKKLKGGE